MMIPLGRVPAWLVCIFVMREVAVTALRGIAISEGIVIAAWWLRPGRRVGFEAFAATAIGNSLVGVTASGRSSGNLDLLRGVLPGVIPEESGEDPSGHDVVQKVPGRLKWGDITLKRGITADMKLWEWRQQVIDGKLKDARSNCSIIMMDRNYEDLAHWDFVNAWPSKSKWP
jgi:hypothetical protein